MSSALEQLPSHVHDLKFADLLLALKERGLDERADKYEAAVMVEAFLHGIGDPLELTIGELARLFTIKPDPMFSVGWDHAYRGKAYYGRNMR